MLPHPYDLPEDSATPADWQRLWQLVEQEVGLTERQVRAMMGRLRLLPHLSTPEGYALASGGHRSANLAHLYFKVRGWTSHGHHLTGQARREWERAHAPGWTIVSGSEMTWPADLHCYGCGAPLPEGYWHSCPACLAHAREN
jgi:hypothetical protein